MLRNIIVVVWRYRFSQICELLLVFIFLISKKLFLYSFFLSLLSALYTNYFTLKFLKFADNTTVINLF